MCPSQDDDAKALSKVVDVKNDRGWTALHCAVAGGHLEMFKLLIASGASPLTELQSGARPLNLLQ